MRTCLDPLAPNDCVCHRPTYLGCVCQDLERALRAYTAGYPMPPMTPEQREWCLAEVDRVEGYSREDYLTATDEQLARAVLLSWASYCQDIGLL